MSRCVWKFGLPAAPGPIVAVLPAGAQLLSVALQFDAPFLWAIVDPAAAPQENLLFASMTGVLLPDHPARHLGTVLLQRGSFVLHYFEAYP